MIYFPEPANGIFSPAILPAANPALTPALSLMVRGPAMFAGHIDLRR
ncbi:MAG TPA: hypothetical protein PLP16_07960 [Smithellaceae bacterium]|nr:hypothetical protein [Smithellaceae bacterium]